VEQSEKMGKAKLGIIGGGGFLGYHIGVDLYQKGHIVTLIDISEPGTDFLEGNVPISSTISEDSNTMFFIKANIASKSELENALKMAQAEAVIHCASYGMSGKEQMPSAWDKTEEINIGGTVNVIKACCALGITSLVYTSSYNVVFGGQEIIDGDESLPYFPLHRHVDHYSRTKSVAEQLVLMADEKSGRNGKTLRTCSLRLAGLIGLKEKRHLPRIVDSLPAFSKFKFKYGEGLAQFVSIENAVQAHVKALAGIISKPEVIGGQAYFISDGEPINNFEYFRPLMEKLGYSYPTLELPVWLVFLAAYFMQIVFMLSVKINPNWTFTDACGSLQDCCNSLFYIGEGY
jgi:nucleoside-diphosphate-sugar epimerase